MSYISIIISGVASLGVFVALILGIFFLVLSGLRWVSKIRSALYEEELLRQKRRLLSKACFNRDGTWNLMETNKNHQSFSAEDHSRDTSRLISNVLDNWKDEKEEENNKKHGKLPPHTLLFRELIEKKIEELIGGSLDGIPVGRFSTHYAYLAIFSKYHSLLCQEIENLGLALQSSILNENVIDSKVLNHQIMDLKKLLKQIISDVTSLPTITETLCDDKITNSSNYDDFHDKTYEDILATAILNKIIKHFQNTTDAEILTLYQSNCQTAKCNEKDEEESISSSDSSEFSQLENLSFTLEEHIEEITNEYDLSEDEETVEDCEFESNFNKSSFLESGSVLESEVLYDDHVLKEEAEEQVTKKDTVNSTSSWEDNWLFQKKRFRSTPNVHHPVPVPMLVPKPSNNFRALVGGVDADDLSDMSDCSDSVFETRLITLTDPDTNDLSSDSDKNENETTVNDGVIDTSKSIAEPLSTDLQSENGCQSKEITESKDFFSKNLGKTFTDDRDVEEENFKWSRNFDSNIILSKAKSNTSLLLKEEEEEIEHLVENGEEKWNHSELITDTQYFSINNEEKEPLKENEYFRTETCFKKSPNFSDDTTCNLFDEKKPREYIFLRENYVNASKNPSGMISPKPLTRFSEEIEHVSKQKYENLSSQQGKVCRRNSMPYASVRETNWCSFPTMEGRIKQNKRWFLKDHHNFAFIDKKGKREQEKKLVSKYQNESHSLNLLKVTRSSNHKKLSLHQHFSSFEQKALRENLSHFLMRARGASPNFILNPIFMPDIHDFKVSDYSSYLELDNLTKISKRRGRETNSNLLMNYYKQKIKKEKSTNDREKGEAEGRKSRESGYSSDIFDCSL